MVHSFRHTRTVPRWLSPKGGLKVLAGLLAIGLILVPGSSTPAQADNAVPAFVGSSGDLDFGEVPVGDVVVLDVVFTNVSSSPQVLSLAGGGIGQDSDFRNSSPAVHENCIHGRSVAPGDSCAWAYSFAPQSLGAQDDSTAITLNDVQYPVTVVGVGVLPRADLPQAPVMTDEPGFENDSFIVPSIEGIEYRLENVLLTPGAEIAVSEAAYSAATGRAELVLEPSLLPGYSFPGGHALSDYAQILVFTLHTTITAPTSTAIDGPGISQDAVELPLDPRWNWQLSVGGEPAIHDAGVYQTTIADYTNQSAVVIATATPAAGY